MSTTSALSATRSATFVPDQTCQSLPEPQELGGNCTGAPTNPSSSASLSVPTRTPASGSARSSRASQIGPSYHQWPNNSVSKAATTWAGRPMRSDSLIEPLADQVDEVGDVGVDGAVGALRVIGRLGGRRRRRAR